MSWRWLRFILIRLRSGCSFPGPATGPGPLAGHTAEGLVSMGIIRDAPVKGNAATALSETEVSGASRREPGLGTSVSNPKRARIWRMTRPSVVLGGPELMASAMAGIAAGGAR